MKNIHLIPTDKPSRLSILNSGKLNFGAEIMSSSNSKPQNIYITSDVEIKEGEWYENNGVIFKADDVFDEGNNPNNSNPRVTDFNIKIILTTDKDLIKDGVQAIDDDFLEWFVKNPSCEEVETELVEFEVDMELGDSCIEYGSYYKIIIPNEEPKQIKCYCGHTIMCDCSPIDESNDVVLGYKTSLDAQMLDKIEHIDEAFGVIYVLETLLDFAGEDKATSISISTTDAVKIIKLLKQIK